MIYVIADPCIDVKDRSCVEVCPVDCIHTDDDDRICYIDPDECIACNVCLSACPVAAISTEGDVPGPSAAFVEINALWFRDREAARAMVDGFAR